MKRFRPSRPSPALVVSIIALIVAMGGTGYAAILSNPPLHQGIAEDHGLLRQLIAEAPRLLTPSGVLLMVVQRRIPLDELLAGQFAEVTVAA